MLTPTERVPERPLTAWVLDGRSLGSPKGDFSFVYPRVIEGEKGAVHLVWAEPRSARKGITGAYWPPDDLATLWASTLSADGSWSPAARIYEAVGQLVWEQEAVGRILDGRGLALVDLGSSVTIVLIRARDREWRVDRVDEAGFDPAVERSADGRTLYVAYSGIDRTRRSSSNVLMVRMSKDDGLTWSDQIDLASAPGTRTNGPRLFPRTDGTIDVIWRQRGGDPPRRLKHAIWDPRVLTLKPVAEIEIPGDASAFSSAADGCGRMHVVYVHGGATMHVDHLVFGGPSIRREHLEQTAHASESVLSITADGATLVYLGTAGDDTRQMMFMKSAVCVDPSRDGDPDNSH